MIEGSIVNDCLKICSLYSELYFKNGRVVNNNFDKFISLITVNQAPMNIKVLIL